jgi:hypothetical protein
MEVRLETSYPTLRAARFFSAMSRGMPALSSNETMAGQILGQK